MLGITEAHEWDGNFKVINVFRGTLKDKSMFSYISHRKEKYI